MAGSWQPKENVLREVLQLLKEAQSPDNSKQREMLQNLDVLMKDPVVNNYLIFVLTKLTSEDEKTRSLSGLFLKKNIQVDFQNFPPAVATLIRSECLSGLGDPSPRIRATLGIIVKTVVSTGGLDNWPDLLRKLCQMHSANECPACVCGGAIVALQKICEVSMGDLLQGLMLLAAGYDVKVRTNVCRAFVSLVSLVDGIIECVLGLTQDANDEVALGACKLWSSLARKKTVCKDVLNPHHLARLLPLLLKWMRLSDRDVIVLLKLKADDEEEDKEDHYDSDEDGENSNDSGFDALSDGNLLWVSSGAVLHKLSNVFKDELLPALLPSLKEMLYDPEWTIKISGMLALVAIAEGCKTGIADHLVELVPFLISCLSEENALVRGSACIILSGYADWVVSQPQYLTPLMTELLKRVLDEDKSVQEAACSSLITIQEEAGTKLVPYMGDILETLVRAYGKYHRKNLATLYNTIGTMIRSLGSHLNKPGYINLLMPPFIAKLDVLKDDDDDLVPLMECLLSVAKALQSGFLPYFEPLFSRCISIVDNTLNQCQANEQQPDQFQAPDKDCMKSALDLLSGLTEVLGSHAENKLIVPSKMMQLLHQSMQDITPEVRKSSFALLGYLTKECFDHILPYLPEFLPILSQNLNAESDSDVWTNAITAVGEITIKLGNEMRSYIPLFLTQLIAIINRPNTPKVCLENTAFTLGRLGYVCAREVAPHLKEFAQRWFVSMRDVRDQEEMKDLAFRGMCKMLAVNDQGIEKDVFLLFYDAVASWPNPRSDLKEKFAKILKSFKRSAGEEGWKEITDQFPPSLREHMKVQYGV